MIYRDFVSLLFIGFVLAIPLSHYLLNEWLLNFTYHTTIDAITYVVSLLVLAITVTVTIAYQAVIASLASPVKSLRSE